MNRTLVAESSETLVAAMEKEAISSVGVVWVESGQAIVIMSSFTEGSHDLVMSCCSSECST